MSQPTATQSTTQCWNPERFGHRCITHDTHSINDDVQTHSCGCDAPTTWTR